MDKERPSSHSNPAPAPDEILSRLDAIAKQLEELKPRESGWKVSVLIAIIGAVSGLAGAWIGAQSSRPQAQALAAVAELSGTKEWQFYQDSKLLLVQIQDLHDEFCRFAEFSRDSLVNSRLQVLYEMSSAAPDVVEPAVVEALAEYNDAVAEDLTRLRASTMSPGERVQRCRQTSEKKRIATERISEAVRKLVRAS